jgi:excinuclease ABC subunit A
LIINELDRFYDFVSFHNYHIVDKLKVLKSVGLGYLKLGQSATTLSGGEAQRIKISKELNYTLGQKTLYLLDEPTTGLHFDDLKKLLYLLRALVARGDTVLLIEHNLNLIKESDWLIDLGPEGGEAGGQVLFQGTPIDILKEKDSWTAKYLKES